MHYPPSQSRRVQRSTWVASHRTTRQNRHRTGQVGYLGLPSKIHCSRRMAFFDPTYLILNCQDGLCLSSPVHSIPRFFFPRSNSLSQRLAGNRPFDHLIFDRQGPHLLAWHWTVGTSRYRPVFEIGMHGGELRLVPKHP